MKIKELRAKKTEDLNALVADLKKEALNLRFQQTTGQLINTSRVKEVRRTVARAQTLLVEKVNAKVAKR
jgi:large subunit ribosomal protein L29